MARDLLSLLAYEARRRPELADLVTQAELGTLDEDAIAAAPVKLPWMRQALRMLSQAHQQEALAALVQQWVVDGHTADPIGETRRWEGGSTFIQVGRTQLQVECGQLIWLQPNGVWIDTIWSAVIDPLLLRQTVGCGMMRRSEYMSAVRDRARQLCPESSISVSQPMERVRFYRPG